MSKFGRSGCYKLSVFVPSHSVFVFDNVKHFNELRRFFGWYCCYLNNFRSSRGKRFYEKAAVKNILKFSEKRNSDRDNFSEKLFCGTPFNAFICDFLDYHESTNIICWRTYLWLGFFHGRKCYNSLAKDCKWRKNDFSDDTSAFFRSIPIIWQVILVA